MASMFDLYEQWPASEPPAVVYRDNSCGDNCRYLTWPLPFHGESSLSSLMKSCDWLEEEIEVFHVRLADGQSTEQCIIWLDVMEVFRTVVSQATWNQYEDIDAADMLQCR